MISRDADQKNDVDLADWVDEIADQFEAGWKSGQPAPLALLVAELDNSRRALLLPELIRIDLEYRQRNGMHPRVGDYFVLFPDLAADERIRDELILFAYTLSARRSKSATETSGSGEVASPVPSGMVLGKYHLGDLIGSGTFGNVYKARDVELSRTVAIKLPRFGYYLSSDDEKRFFAEARIAGQLRHPGIVCVHEIGRDGETPYIVSDFIEGQTLERATREQRFSHDDAARVVMQIARAVDYAHENGLVHRDLKPTNILMDGSRVPLVTDFGLARFDRGESMLTADGQILGTPAYMAPEQAAGDSAKVDRRSDVYSLGVILYELLTGKLPFHGSMHTMLAQVVGHEPTPPRRLDKSIPYDLATICQKAMRKTRELRYSTANDMAEDLRRFLDHEPIRARPVGQIERLRLWSLRNPLIAALTAIVSILLVAIGVGGTWSAVVQSKLANANRVTASQLQSQLSQSQAERGVMRLEQGDPGGLDELIQSHGQALQPEDIRSRNLLLSGWSHTVDDLTLQVIRHDQPVFGATLSPDGAVLATVDRVETVRIWETSSGRLVRILRPTAPSATYGFSLQFSHDGKKLLVTNVHGSLRLWDLDSGTSCSFDRSDGVLDPLGRWIATSGDVPGQITIRDFQSRVLQQLDTRCQLYLTVSPDGRFLAGGSIRLKESDPTGNLRFFGEVQLWAAEDWKALSLLKHGDGLAAIAFSPDGEIVATGSVDDTVRLWKTATGEPIGPALVHDEDVRDVVFSSDGQLLASASMDGSARIWDVPTVRLRHRLSLRGEPVRFVRFSHDGRTMATVSSDFAAKLWDVATGEPQRWQLRHNGTITAVEFSPDDRTLMTSSHDTTARLWNVREPDTIQLPHTHRVWSVDFSPDSQRLVTTSELGTVWIWKQAGNVWELEREIPSDEPTLAATFSPDGTRILVGDCNRLRLIHLEDGTDDGGTVTSTELAVTVPQQYRSVAFDPAGKHVAGGIDGHVAVLYDLRDSSHRILQHPPIAGRPSHVWDVEFTRDGSRLATAYEDGGVRIWDTHSGQQFGETLVHDGAVSAIAMGDDGQLLVTAAESGVRIWSWNGSSWGTPRRLLSQLTPVNALDLSHGDRVVITASRSGQVRLWDIQSGLSCGPAYETGQSALSVQVSPDNRWLAAGTLGNRACVWRLPDLGDQN